MVQFACGFIFGMVMLFGLIIGIVSTSYESASKNFFVRSTDTGYRVCIKHGTPTTCVTKDFSSATDADILAKQLNKDMENNWER